MVWMVHGCAGARVYGSKVLNHRLGSGVGPIGSVVLFVFVGVGVVGLFFFFFLFYLLSLVLSLVM